MKTIKEIIWLDNNKYIDYNLHVQMYMYTHVHVCRQTHLVTYVYYTYMYSGTPYNGLEDTSPF